MPIIELKGRILPDGIGNKAGSLLQLIKWGYPVPRTWVCTWFVYERYLAGDSQVLSELEYALEKVIIKGKKYAVRSSTNLEDDKEFSFAGQFRTELEIEGAKGILNAIISIWEDASKTLQKAYNLELPHRTEALKVAVIIQEYIVPVFSGVSFSIDPVTGQNQTIIEGVRGSGEQLVQQGATPFRWVFKQYKPVTSPDEGSVNNLPAKEIAGATSRLAKKMCKPIDLEWVYDGKIFFWLQMREITGLHKANVYSNKVSREMLPGMIKPLVFAVNIPLVTQAHIRLLMNITGKLEIQPETLVRSFYYRAYFNMGQLGNIFESFGLPADSAESMMGVRAEGQKSSHQPSFRMLKHLFRVFRFIPKMLRHGSILKKKFFPLEARIKSFDRLSVEKMSASEVMEKYDYFFRINQEIAYYNTLTPILNYIYNSLLKRKLKKSGIIYEELDFTPDPSIGESIDPNHYLKSIHKKICDLPDAQRTRLNQVSFHDPGFTDEFPWLHGDIENFLADFGHFSESGNDFSVPPWRENPDLILKMITQMGSLQSEGSARVRISDLKLPRLKKISLIRSFRRAAKYRYYRDRVSSAYTYGYGLFRDLFLRIGRILHTRGIIGDPADVFYLNLQEVKQAILTKDEQEKVSYGEWIESRKKEMSSYCDIVLPSVIYGDETPPPESSHSIKYDGIAASPGYYTGKCVIVKGFLDFDRVSKGDIIVIPYSDVGWTPVFVRAGAIIAESGGILSHSSIVARELNIPAIVSVENACLIPEGTKLSVDGYKGRIHVINECDSII